MPELPIFFGSPIHSLKAVMAFPRHPYLARAFAGWLMMRVWVEVRQHAPNPMPDFQKFSDFINLDDDDVREEFVQAALAATEFAYVIDEAEETLKDGVRAGIVVVCLFALIFHEPEKASWEAAIEAAEQYFARHNKNLAASRASFRQCLAKVAPVLHLFGARMLRGHDQDIGLDKILYSHCDPGAGYTAKIDSLFFAHEARHLQIMLMQWDSRRKPRSKYLEEMLELTGPWTPPPRQPGWPDTGTVRRVKLDPWIKIVRGRPGRPRSKTTS